LLRKLLLACACAWAYACAEPAPAPQTGALVVQDDAGRTVRLAQPAQRVVSLLPTVTDLLLAMNEQDRLLARTDFDTDRRIAQLRSLGGGLTPSVEWLAQQQPDLVIAWPDHGSRSLVDRLASVDVPVYSARTESIADTHRILDHLGTLLGITQKTDSLSGSIRSALDSVRNATSNRTRVNVAYIVGIDPPMVAAAGTFIDELITVAGGRNIFPDLELWPQINLEELLQRDPDVVVLADTQTDEPVALLRSLPGWRELRAVRLGRVFRVSPYFFNRSGPTMPNAARELARFFHEQ
jgi:ABC-type Fe3+-hydroxamate transport system substrate-binding protein